MIPRRRRGIVPVAGLAVLLVAAGVTLAHHAPGPVVRTLALQHPWAVAVDARTGRTFVASGVITFGYASGSHIGSISVLDTATGALLRTITIRSGLDALALDARTGRVFVAGAASPVVSMLDARSGSLLRAVPVGPTAAHLTGMAVDERSGRVFVFVAAPYSSCTTASPCGSVSVLDATSGRLLHTFDTQEPTGLLAIDARTDHLIIASDTFGTTGGGTVSIVDATSGRLLRSVAVGPIQQFAQWQPLAVDAATGRAFVGTTSFNPGVGGTVYVIDTHNGALVHTVHLGYVPQSITVDERAGRVFVATLGLMQRMTTLTTSGTFAVGPGYLDELDARRGAVLHTTTVGVMPIAVAVDARYGHVLVANRGAADVNGLAGPGSVSVVDARTGAVLRAIPVGVQPGALAVDATAGRAVVANLGGPVHVSDPWGWMPGWLRSRLPFIPRYNAHTRLDPGSVTVLDTSR